MLNFHLFLAVWGDAYIDPMVKLTIPTLLFDRNIPALSARHECKIVFFIRDGEEAKIRSAPSVARLAETARIEFVPFDPDAERNPFLAMSKAHYLGGMAAREVGARVIVAAPDAIFANGVLAHVGKLAEQGKSAVMCPGLRLLQETAAPALARRIEASASPVEPREMVSFMLEHLHPEVQSLFFDSTNFADSPAVCCWSLGKKGVLARCFHPHPLMIDFSRIDNLDILKKQTIDGSFLARGLASWDDIHVETDSDNIHLCTLTPREVFYSFSFSRFKPASVGKLRRFAHCHPDSVESLHRDFFRQAIKMHVGDLDEEWSRVEEETAKIAAAALRPLGPMAIRAGRALNEMTRIKNGVARRIWTYQRAARNKRNVMSLP
jgi:hypothetical protein